jgi:hypothetical protein
MGENPPREQKRKGGMGENPPREQRRKGGENPPRLNALSNSKEVPVKKNIQSLSVIIKLVKKELFILVIKIIHNLKIALLLVIIHIKIMGLKKEKMLTIVVIVGQRKREMLLEKNLINHVVNILQKF